MRHRVTVQQQRGVLVGDLLHMMALPRAAPPNWPDVEAPPIVRLGKCQGETKREAQRQQLSPDI